MFILPCWFFLKSQIILAFTFSLSFTGTVSNLAGQQVLVGSKLDCLGGMRVPAGSVSWVRAQPPSLTSHDPGGPSRGLLCALCTQEMCALPIGSLGCPHKRLVLGISYVCFRSETPHLVKGLICVDTETYVHKESSFCRTKCSPIILCGSFVWDLRGWKLPWVCMTWRLDVGRL